MSRIERQRRIVWPASALVVLAVVLAGCHHHDARETRDSPQLFFYSSGHHDAARQDRDRYDCFVWAREQTGFDPSRPSLSVEQRLRVTAVLAPPGSATKRTSNEDTKASRRGAGGFRRAVTVCLEGRGYVVF